MEHRTHGELENTRLSTTSELNLCARIVLGNIRKRGVHGELENKEYSRLYYLSEKQKLSKSFTKSKAKFQ